MVRRLNWPMLFWAGLALIMLLRVFYFGFTYFNYLDDNNTYGVFFRRNGDIWNDIILWYRLYTFRPIAFFADAYITQWFWPRMELVLLFNTVMTFATLVLFKEVLKKSGIRFGVAGLVICALLPLNIEAVYWIGASTRFVPGMFFSVLSCYVLMKFLDKEYGRRNLVLFLYFFFNLIATGFYEQIVVFNFVFTLIIIALNFRRLGYDKAIVTAIPFVSLFAISAHYIFFMGHGERLANRAVMVSSGFISHFASTAGSVGRLLVPANLNMLYTGFFGFFSIDINILQGLALLLILGFALICGLSLLSEEAESDGIHIKILVGVLLAAAPFAPFFLLENNFMAFRNVYPSLFGIAIFIDAVVDILRRVRVGRLAASTLGAVLCFIFLLAGITEINNYRLIETDDNIIAENFLETFRETGFDDTGQIIVLNTRHRFSETSREGFENISSSDWAFLGKLNANTDEFYFKNIRPVVAETESFPRDVLTADTLFLGMDSNMNIVTLRFGSSGRQLYCGLGLPFGELILEGERYRFTAFGS